MCLFLGLPSFGVDLSFKVPKADDSLRNALAQFSDKISELLPLKVREELSREIRVEFKAMGSRNLPNPCRAEGSEDQQVIVGRTVWGFFESKRSGGRIEIHEGFLNAIVLGEKASKRFECGHRSEYQWALATLVHEILHLYDFALEDGPLSDNPRLRKILGWAKGFWGAYQKNTLHHRSPDPYEFEDPKESLAVNFEYFLLDPEFQCRRPALHQFFVEVFEWTPFESTECERESRVFLSQGGRAVDLDPSRIYQVHYLFAARGEKAMSRWGHAMYRLVVCAPERKTVGPECLQDLHHHIVLSYRANVADLVIDYWGGIFGKYPSQLFVYTLSEVIEEYTKGELRELRSLPIELSETEKLGFIHQAQEQYWAYLGRYYFLSNNCATEACDLLQSTQNEESELHRIRSISPLGLYDELIRRGAVSAKVLEPRSVAIEKGFVFASYREKLNEAWTKLRQAGFAKQERLRTLDDYWLKLNAEQRFELWQKLPQKQSLASAFWLMETHVKRRLEKQAYERALALLLEQKSLPKSADNEARQALDSLKETMLNPLPWSRLAETSRYGVPLVGELVQARDPARASSDLRQIYSEIQGFVSKLASREAEEIKRVEDNLRASSRALRRLDKGP